VAVYTVLSADELSAIAAAFGVGTLRAAEGIPHGSINTNFRLQTSQGTFFLRHTTVRSSKDLRFEAALLTHLVEGGYPAPILLWTTDGQPFLEIAAGRASVFRSLAGEELSRADLNADHCEGVGAVVGKLHRVGNSFSVDRANPYGPNQVRPWLTELRNHPDPAIRALGDELQPLLEYSQSFEGGLLPRGAIHADLFMDNVKWLGDRISAVFDFEMACREAFALDLAIALNAWCFDGSYQPDFCRALVRGYQQQRSLGPVEIEALYFQALFGAVRYSASRIRDFHLSPLPPERLARKDYRTYLNRARALRQIGPTSFKELLGLGRS
jgi:homoserine kinase type II